jgi:hypothetical protein
MDATPADAGRLERVASFESPEDVALAVQRGKAV